MMRLFPILCVAALSLLLVGCNDPAVNVEPGGSPAPAPSPTAPPTPASGFTTAPEPTETPAPAPGEASAPEPAETPLAMWESDYEINWALRGEEAVLSRENTPEKVPDSIVQMIPLLETVLDHRIFYDASFDDLKLYDPEENYLQINEHLLENENYFWGLMARVLAAYGEKHPDTMRDGGSVIIPENAVRDFAEVCFYEYTPEFELPRRAPEKWLKRPVSFYPDETGEVMQYADGAYSFNSGISPISSGGGGQFIIFYAPSPPHFEQYTLQIISSLGPEGYDLTVFRVSLQRAEKPNALGLEWRIESIVVMGATEGLEVGC